MEITPACFIDSDIMYNKYIDWNMSALGMLPLFLINTTVTGNFMTKQGLGSNTPRKKIDYLKSTLCNFKMSHFFTYINEFSHAF